MAEHALNYRGMTYLVSTSLGWDCGWTVFVDGEAALFGYTRSSGKSGAFRAAVQQAQAAIDAMLAEEQAA